MLDHDLRNLTPAGRHMVGQHQCPIGAGVNASRALPPPLAQVTLGTYQQLKGIARSGRARVKGENVTIGVARGGVARGLDPGPDRAVRAGEYTGPAADAAGLLHPYHSVVVPVKCSGQAGVKAEGFFTLMAGRGIRESPIGGFDHPQPRCWQYRTSVSRQGVGTPHLRHHTGELTEATTNTRLLPRIDPFQGESAPTCVYCLHCLL